jgi:hypothetical protein
VLYGEIILRAEEWFSASSVCASTVYGSIKNGPKSMRPNKEAASITAVFFMRSPSTSQYTPKQHLVLFKEHYVPIQEQTEVVSDLCRNSTPFPKAHLQTNSQGNSDYTEKK